MPSAPHPIAGRASRHGRALLALAALAAPAALPTVATAQQTSIRGFADVTLHATHGDSSQRASFQIGQYDLYVSSKINERLSFLGESVFEFDESDWGVDVERVVLAYEVSPLFRVAAGKHHTPIGYWNTTYHHGTFLQPTIERPEMFRFEDDGGILTIHSVGLGVSGHGVGPLRMGYDLMVANRAGGTASSDRQDAKAYTMALHAMPAGPLMLGVSAHFNRIPAGAAALDGSPMQAPVAERLIGGYATLDGLSGAVTGEYQRVHDAQGAAGAHDVDAWYLYAGRRLGQLMPYVRYDAVAGTLDDPYLGIGGSHDVRQGLFGVRYDLAQSAALKLEARRRREAGGPSFGVAAAQFSVWF